MNAKPVLGHDARLTDWIGHVTGVREVMMGSLLNLLVVHGVTPHLPLIYEPFHLVKGNKKGFVMELAHLSYTNFLQSKILSSLSREAVDELLDVTMVQIANGLLCAQKHYNFRHNDLHTSNAMMTFITDTTYTYKVDGTYYQVPNHGMCWKLIDFGYSSSTVFGEHDVANAAMHSLALEEVGHSTFLGRLSDYAMELFDVLKFVTLAKRAASERIVITKFAFYEGLIKEITALGAETARITRIGDAKQAFLENKDRKTVEVLAPSSAFSAGMRATGLLELFFRAVASRFEVPHKPPGVVIFDADASPFAGGDVILEGVHDVPVTVSSATGRASLLAAVSPPVVPRKRKTPVAVPPTRKLRSSVKKP